VRAFYAFMLVGRGRRADMPESITWVAWRAARRRPRWFPGRRRL